MSRAADCSIFNISQEHSLAQLKVAWRELADKLHPDHGGDANLFTQAHEAYERLRVESEKPHACKQCNGQGYVLVGSGFVPIRVRCAVCKGKGVIT